MVRNGTVTVTEVREVQAAEEEGGAGHDDTLEEIPSEDDEELAGKGENGEKAERYEDAKEEEAAILGDGEEGVKARSPHQPRLPTTEERRLHELTHWPFRSWCEHRQRGKANSRAHRRNQRQKVKRSCDGGLDLPVVSMDYMYLE